MLKIDTMPNLRLHKTRFEIPYNRKETNKGSLVIVCSNDAAGFVNVVNNKLIYNNKQFYHYTPLMYRRQFFNRTVTYRAIKEREIDNNLVKRTTTLKTDMLLPSINGRNLYFDMSRWFNIYTNEAKRQFNYYRKVEEFFNLLHDIIYDKDFDSYNIKTLIIDLNPVGKEGIKNIEKPLDISSALSLMYFAMKKKPELYKKLNDIPIIFLSDDAYIKLDPSKVERDTYVKFKTEMNRIGRLIIDDDEMEKEIQKEEIAGKVSSRLKERYQFTGNEEETIVSKVVKSELQKKEEQSSTKDKKINENNIVDEIAENPEVVNQIVSEIKAMKVPQNASTIRDKLLREKQKEIKIHDKTIAEILSTEVTDTTIPELDVSDSVDTTNSNMTKIRYAYFDKLYNEKFLQKDIINSILQMNNAQIKVFIRDIKVEDTSDELNAKQTYTVSLEDENRVRHTLTFDIPKFIDNKFLYLNGNKKVINRQLFFKPIIKIEEDTVQVVSNYNKIFIRRYGQKLSVKTEKFRKVLDMKHKGIIVKPGNNFQANKLYETTIEYDELAKSYDYIKIGNAEVYFNLSTVYSKAEELGITVPEGYLLIGFENNKDPILLNKKTQLIGDKDIVDYLIDKAPEDVKSSYRNISTGKKFMYSRAKIMAKDVPLILLLSYCEGLTTVLKKANINHYFTDKRPKITPEQGVVQFEDGYLVYDKYPFENSLLMNAFADIPTRAYKYEEMDKKDVYLDIFDVMFNQRNLSSAFDNFYDFMIDPITREILEDLNYPTEFVDVLIYANRLLADNSYTNENDLSLYRVRSNELVSVYLYKAIANAYGEYRRTAYNNNPTKISIKRDAIIKDILMAQTIEDYSVLNPIVELEKSRVISAKGPSGLNLAEAYTMDKRGYDKSMIGVIGISTSPDANVGVIRQLTKEPNITSVRGYIKIEEDLDKLKDVNLFSPAELLSPLGASRDDSTRTAMAVKQSKHLIPIEKSSPVFISNGAEQVIQYELSKDFAVTAKDDGVIKEVNEESGIVVVEYKNGEREAFDISPKTVKNGEFVAHNNGDVIGAFF